MGEALAERGRESNTPRTGARGTHFPLAFDAVPNSLMTFHRAVGAVGALVSQ